MLGDQFPVKSYGPAHIQDLTELAAAISVRFDRMEITKVSKGQSPQSIECWPWTEPK